MAEYDQKVVEEIRAEYGTINDYEMQRMINRMPKVMDIKETVLTYVNNDSLKRLQRATGDKNKLFYDEEYAKTTRYGTRIAPPAFYYGVFWGSWDFRRGEGFPGVHGLNCGDRMLFLRPLYDGDHVSCTKQEYAIIEKQGKWAGRSLLQMERVHITNQKGELVFKEYYPAIRGERKKAEKKGKYHEIPVGKYTKEDIEKFDNYLRTQENGGDNGRTWESVNVGDETYSYCRGPLTVADEICFLEGVNAPHCRTGLDWLEYRERSPKIAVPDPESGIPEAVERVHWDSFMAREIGMPAAYDYGAMRGAWATMFAANWVGDNGWLAEMELAYRMMNFIGDVTMIKGKVVNKWIGKKSGTHYVDVEFHSMNQRGEDSMPGWFTAALPTKDEPLQFPIDAEADRGGDPAPTDFYGPVAVEKARKKGQLICCADYLDEIDTTKYTIPEGYVRPEKIEF